MDQKQAFRQILEFNKTAFDNNFKAIFLFHSQNEQYILRFLDRANWAPEEWKNATNEWLSAYKRNCDNFKTCIDENYQKTINFFLSCYPPEEHQDKV